MDITEGLGYEFVREETGKRRSKRLEGRNANLDNGSNEVLPREKRKKTASRRKTTAQPRKNRPHQDHAHMNLECCVEKTCLLNQGHDIIALIRADFDKKLYEQQNYYLNSLIDVQSRTVRNRITYNIRDVSGLRKVEVCKKAFLKMFGIGNKRIDVLLRKNKPYSGDIEQDQRRFNRNERKLPLTLKAEVIQHIRSYDRQPSHYAREKTRDRQFLASNLTIAQLFRDFLENKGLRPGDNNLPLSYSTFRRIFRMFKLSFRRPYIDTCGRCDSFLTIMKYSQDEEDIASAQGLKTSHIEQAEEHYECIRFDLNVLTKLKNKANGMPWRIPPIWKR